MIELHGVSKYVGQGLAKTCVLDEIDLTIPSKVRMVVLGHRGSGKSTLLQIIAGVQLASSGRVDRRSTASPPSGLMRFSKAHFTVRQFVGQLAQIYNMDRRALVDFVAEFAGIAADLDELVSRLPGPVRQRADFALIFGIPFDLYLFDERIAPPTPVEFRNACQEALRQRLQHSGMIFTTSSVRLARQFDASGAVLHNGKLYLFPKIEDAVECFESLPPSSSYLPMQPEDVADLDRETEIGASHGTES